MLNGPARNFHRIQAQGRGGAFQRSIASLRRAGVHGGTPRACAKQDSAAQCAPPPQVAEVASKNRAFARDRAGTGGTPGSSASN